MRKDYQLEVVTKIKSLDRMLQSYNLGRVINVGRIHNQYQPSEHYDIFMIETKARKANHANVLLTAGIHGGAEPMTVPALLEFFGEEKKEKIFLRYIDHLSFQAYPCLNPVGLAKGERFNLFGVDMNREFIKENPSQDVRMIKELFEKRKTHYAGVINLHEDNTDDIEEGFPKEDNPRELYIYEISPSNKKMGEGLMRFLEENNVAVYKKDKIYDDKCENGVIWQSPEAPPHSKFPGLEDYLNKRGFSKFLFEIETPTCWKEEKRIKAHLKSLTYLLDYFREKAKEMAGDLPLKR